MTEVKKPIAKINQRSLGDPGAALKAMAETDQRFVMGTIYGEASGIATRSTADGEGRQEGLKGAFECVSYDPKIGTDTSSVMFVPPGMADNFIGVFRKKEGAPASMLVGMEVAITRAKNPQGFQWEITPLVADMNAVDPLALAREAMAKAVAERAKMSKRK